jgi:hypothetical protein
LARCSDIDAAQKRYEGWHLNVRILLYLDNFQPRGQLTIARAKYPNRACKGWPLDASQLKGEHRT